MRLCQGRVFRLTAALCLTGLLATGATVTATSSAASPPSKVTNAMLAGRAGAKGQPGYLVYWDQNEEVDFLSMP